MLPYCLFRSSWSRRFYLYCRFYNIIVIWYVVVFEVVFYASIVSFSMYFNKPYFVALLFLFRS